jgi:hypothetical protein
VVWTGFSALRNGLVPGCGGENLCVGWRGEPYSVELQAVYLV